MVPQRTIFPNPPQYSARQLSACHRLPPAQPPFSPLTLPLLPGVSLDLIVAMFDVDDVLWPLVNTVTQIVNVDYSKWYTFAIRDNIHYTDAEKDAIFLQFRDAKMFEQLPFYPGVERLKHLHQQGIKVRINSKSSTAEVAEVKRTRLRQILPFLTDDDLILTIYGHDAKSVTGKDIGPEITFFVDDSPYNITKSNAVYNLVPCNQWSTNPTERARMHGKNYYLQNGLDCIIETILRSVHFWRHPSLLL